VFRRALERCGDFLRTALLEDTLFQIERIAVLGDRFRPSPGRFFDAVFRVAMRYLRLRARPLNVR
jgi:hypothetical protein